MTLDTGGSVLGRQAHLPFGEDFAESGTQEKHHFTSYERDSESGTDYGVNRGYSPVTGRFMRPDPYHGTAAVEAPQSLNRYAYVRDDPVNLNDPMGLIESNIIIPGWWCVLWPAACGIVDNTFGLPRTYEPEPIPKGSALGGGPARCSVQVPTDPNIQAAVAVLLGEGTSEYRIGQQQYQGGDKPDHPTGETKITADLLYAEMVEMVSVIANRARVGGFGGNTWKDVASSGGFVGYQSG